MTYIRFLAVIALLFYNSLLAQSPEINTLQSDSSDKFINEIEPTEIITKLSSMNRQSVRQENSESKINYVPAIVFGLSGMFLGAWAGHAIEDKEDIPGEIPEVFTKGTIIGAGVGLATGATIGYFLGKRSKEKHNNPSFIRARGHPGSESIGRTVPEPIDGYYREGLE